MNRRLFLSLPFGTLFAKRIGQRTTGQAITGAWFKNLTTAQLTLPQLLNRMKNKQVNSPRYEWFEDDYRTAIPKR